MEPLDRDPHPPDAFDTSGAQDEFLALWGGWILLVVGVALIVLAFAYDVSSVIAPVSLVLGTACVVLAVVLSRTEGPVRFGAQGIEIAIRRVRRNAQRDRRLYENQKHDVASEAEARLAELPRTVSALRAWVQADDVYARARDRYLEFEQYVQEWLESQGWEVERLHGGDDPDFVAVRDSERMYVEVAATHRPLTAAHLGTWLARLSRSSADDPGSRLALFAAAPRLTANARQMVEATFSFEVYLFDGVELRRIDDPGVTQSGS
ncbi:MAG: restriction endonuclease [Actinomycetota bacterium]|nr:restriction endonuclease [Actinomycetota bacterium]